MNATELHDSIISNAELTFARSSGKGGQNVNKVNTKVRLTLPLAKVGGITEEERLRLREKLAPIINSSGCIFVYAEDERTQELNRKIAYARMESRIVNALAVQKKRKKTKPTKASKERRLMSKKLKGEIKRGRRWSDAALNRLF